METLCEITNQFEKRFRGECRASAAWKILRQVFLKKPHARLEEVLRGCRVIVLFFPNGTQRFWWDCCTTNRSRLSGGDCMSAPRGRSTVSISGSDRKIVGDAWIPRFFRCEKAFVASLDVKTTFDVANTLCGSPNGGGREGPRSFVTRDVHASVNAILCVPHA